MSLNKDTHISVVLATYNEAANIGRCLESVAGWVDEIVVVDGNSVDETVDIAKRFGAQVIETTNKAMFHTNKQMAITAAHGDWILQLDADEVVDDELREAVLTLVKQGSEVNGFYIKRKNFFLGKFLTKGGQYPDAVIRLFKQGKGRLPQKSVHEQISIDGDVRTISGHLLHYNAPTFRRYLTNANRYTSLTAKEMKTKRVQLNWRNDMYYLFIKPFITFANIYFKHRGYVDGFSGFVFAMFSGLHFALAYMKLGDLYAGRD